MNLDQHTSQRPRTVLSTPSEREIVTERVFAAPRERVVAAFTEPQLVARWWGLDSTTTTVEALDLRPGGAWRFVERNQDGSEHGFRGYYREVSLPDRLAYSFEWEGLPGHAVIDTVTFEDLGDRTRVTVHSLFHTPEERDWMLKEGMERGLNESYGKLDSLLAEGTGAPR
jgi:uncharacterized protein YndB with AHSA1/START domain